MYENENENEVNFDIILMNYEFWLVSRTHLEILWVD